MSRFSYYDTDEERLPEGMTRVGYDADTQVYTYRDSDGSLWEGVPGAQYGSLTRVSGPSSSQHHYAPEITVMDNKSWRQEMMPLLNFFLIIGVFLIGVFWFMRLSLGPAAEVRDCGAGASYTVRTGDTCWEIAEAKGTSVGKLVEVNEGLDCDQLQVGEVVCLPEGK